MRHLKVGHKLLAIVVGLAVPAIVLLTLSLKQESRKISSTQRELTGVDYVGPVLALIKDVQLHRRIASGTKSGSATQAELDRQSRVVASDLAALAAVDDRLRLVDELGLRITALTDHWADLSADLPNLSTLESSDRHSALIAQDIDPMLGAIGAGTGLSLDPTRGGYFLQDLVLSKLPSLAERLGQARLYGLGLSGRDGSQAAQLAVPVIANSIRSAQAQAAEGFAFAQAAKADLSVVQTRAAEANAATAALLDLLTSRLVADGVDATAFTATATKAIDAQFDAAAAVADATRAELGLRLVAEKRSREVALLGMLAMLLIGALLAWSVARRLTRPVHRLDEAYAKVREGDFSVEVAVDSRDELGRLSGAFNETVRQLAAQHDEQRAQLARAEQLQADVAQYTGFARRVAEGDLTARMAIAEERELADLGNALNLMVESLGRLSGEVRGASGELAGATTQILSVVRQHSSATSEQAASIAQTTVAVNEVRASAEQAATRAKEVAESALRAVEVAEDGTNAVDDIVSGIAVIRSRVETIAAQIAALSTQTGQIDEITRSVSDIADQSNMLALNATIEAAKAGEHGRGFAVVANEVRVLAEQSKTATLQVRELLAQIGRATTAAVEATEVGTRSAEIGVERARLAGAAIEQLSTVVKETAAAADAIAASAREQAVGMDEINRAIAGVSSATIEIAGGANETESAASGLSTLADYLGDLTRQFRVGDGSSSTRQIAQWRDARLTALETELSSVTAVGDAAGIVARAVAAAFGADCALVARFDDEEAVPIGVVLPEGQRVRNFSLSGRTGLATVNRTGAPVRINDYRSLGDEGAARMARAGDYTNGVAAPVRFAGGVWGGLLVATRSEEPLPIETEMFLANAAVIFADVLEKPGVLASPIAGVATA